MKLPTRLLKRLFPGWGFLVVMVLLAASGLWLRETERFASIAWGLTEMVHVHLGWLSLLGTIAYLVHHLARTWGPLSRPQRLLGLALVAVTAVAFVTGVILVLGLRGGPPAWVRPVHWWTTWAVLVLFAWHSAKGWGRLVVARIRRTLRRPQSKSSPMSNSD